MRKETLKVLVDIANKINSSIDVEEVLQEIVSIAQAQLDVKRVSVFLLKNDILTLRAFAGFAPTTNVTIALGKGITGKVAQTGKECVVNHGSTREELGYKASSFLSLPLVSRGVIIGVLNLTDKSDDFFSDVDLQIAQYVASQCALAVERTRLYKERQSGERLQMIGMLRASVAHDIKNLLGIVQVYLDMMEQSTMCDDNKEYVEAIRAEIHRVQGLSLDMLEYSKQKIELKKTVFNLEQLVNEIYRQNSLALRHTDINIAYKCDKDIFICADRDRLFRVIFNLVNNAINILGERSGNINIYAKTKGDRATIIVKDDGPGVKPENTKKLFDPFFTSGNEKGTGLGLAIVKEIISAHNGTIKVRSTYGKYAMFVIRIPYKYDDC